jgi:hypothetical protein
VYLYFYNGTTKIGEQPIPIANNTPWRVVGTADFNNDGRSDILWHNVTTGQMYIWYMTFTNGVAAFGSGAYVTNAAMAPEAVLGAWKIVGVGDFSGDSKPDILWHNEANGAMAVWFLNGAVTSGSLDLPYQTDPAWKVRAVGNYYGDATPDVLWQNTQTGAMALWVRQGSSIATHNMNAVQIIWRVVGAK